MDKKNKIIKKSLNIINKDNKNIVKAPNQFIKKKLVLIDKNIHHLHNLESIISPLTKPKEDNLNDNLTLNIKDNTNEQINININICEQNNSKINDKNKNIYDINTFHIMETKNLSNKSINSHSNSGNKEIIITPHPYSMKFSIESLGNMKDNFISLNNKKENSFNNKKNNIKNLYKKNSTFYEQNKNAFKLLPILNKNFNSTINNSDRINKNIKSFKKESKIRNKLSQRKTTKITKKFFDKIEIPTIRKTLRISKQRSWSKEVNKFIYKNKKGQIKFKFSYEKKSKSPLTFVEEYNRMRNRRKKNNKKITSNIGFRVCSKKEVKENKQKTYFGLTINNNKYY